MLLGQFHTLFYPILIVLGYGNFPKDHLHSRKNKDFFKSVG